MHSTDPIYPAKQTYSPDGEFIIPRFFLPIRIHGEEVWALLDTGANISIIPQEISQNIIPQYKTPINQGTYPLAGLVEVPYKSYELDFDILRYIEGTMKELDLMSYADGVEAEVCLRGVEFQVPELTWPEMAEKLEAETPISVHGAKMSFVIFGLYGVLDQMTLSFVGDNSVAISSIGPD